ncbi:MAG: RNA 3'-terminal phosphate cyclase [Candidatus Nanohaloarchaea archaeon]|nr:RNA 3'-terminal phosphate cyclase [Candidatus Nanohaloarchaea archaeon]
MLELDGSIGGGAVVRVALGLSIATGTPFRLENARSGRPDPGLKHQHLAGVEAAAELSAAEVEGAERGSQELVFSPGETLAEAVTAEIPTAGSVGLLLQPLWIAAAGADHEVSVTVDGGATAGKWAPPVHYLEHVALPLLGRFGHPSSVDIRRHGFYPEGGALVKAGFGPSDLDRIELLEQGAVERVEGLSIASEHLKDAEVAERQRNEARRVIAGENPSLELDIGTRYVEARSPGSSILLWSDTRETIVGGDQVGEKGKRAETVGREAAGELRAAGETGAPLDAAMSDMVVPFLALAGGDVRVQEVTDHVECNVRVANRFTEREITVEGRRLEA